jgi:opacity protein-like surface antigen
MRSNGSKLFLAVLLSVVGGAAVARAEEAAPPSQPIAKPVKELPWFAGLTGGAGYGTISHPVMVPGSAAMPVLNLHGGYTFGDHLSLGLEFTSTETSVGRDSDEDPFQLGHKPQAIWHIPLCSPCEPRPRGGEITGTSLVFSTIGARVEYTPFSRDGLYVGGTAGMAFMVGFEEQLGFGFAGRVGYRIRATNVLTLSIEGGMAGQVYEDATMYMPFGAAVARVYFERFITPYPPGYWDRRK